MQSASDLIFVNKLSICVKSTGFSQPVLQIIFSKILALLKPIKAIDSDSSMLVLSRERFPSVEATFQGPDEKYWLSEYNQIGAKVNNFESFSKDWGTRYLRHIFLLELSIASLLSRTHHFSFRILAICYKKRTNLLNFTSFFKNLAQKYWGSIRITFAAYRWKFKEEAHLDVHEWTDSETGGGR